MKTILLAAAVVMAGAGFAYADEPGKDWVPKDQVMKTLQEAGFTDVKDITAEDGHWETDATIDGKMWDVDIDPHTGKISKVEKDK